MLIDTHCHLFKEYYSDIEKVINDAKENNVLKYISAADSISSCYEMLELANNFEDVYIALGIHPQNVDDDVKKLEEILEDNLNNKKIVAIGEIGLDYYYGKDTKEKQIELFEQQLSLAKKLDLPVIVHSREATLDTINCLKKYPVKGIIHCFSGSLETANEYIKMGFYIGVGGVMTFKNSKLKDVIKDIPLNKITLETDSPYLTPEPYRKYSNEPKYIKVIAEKLAEIKGDTTLNVETLTTKNVLEIFDI